MTFAPPYRGGSDRLMGTLLPRLTCKASSFFKSLFFVVLTIFTELDPIGRCAVGPRVIHARHSELTIFTRLVRCLRPSTGRSVIVMWSSFMEGCLDGCPADACQRRDFVDRKVADPMMLDLAGDDA
jgi:hypothetical protein